MKCNPELHQHGKLSWEGHNDPPGVVPSQNILNGPVGEIPLIQNTKDPSPSPSLVFSGRMDRSFFSLALSL